MRKFKRAVTDSQGEVRRGPDKPGINNLITIYSVATGLTPEQVEEQFSGKGYGDFKTACGEAVVEMLRPFREQVEDLMKNKDYLDQVAREGADMAARLAQRTLSKVQKKVGFVPKP